MSTFVEYAAYVVGVSITSTLIGCEVYDWAMFSGMWTLILAIKAS